MEEVREHCNSEVSVVLIGNKCDLEEELGNSFWDVVILNENRRQVSYQEGEEFAKENNMMFLETSAKLAKNVEQVII